MERAYVQLENLWDPVEGTPEYDQAELLGLLIFEYENRDKKDERKKLKGWLKINSPLE